MSIATTVSAMTAAGCSAEQINAVVQVYEAERARIEEEKRAARREGNAERQRRLRERRNANNAVMQRDAALCGVTERDSDPATSDSAPTRVVITNLPSEDINIKTNTSCLQKTPSEKQKSVRGSRLPLGWMPDDAGRKLASDLLGNSGARLQLEKFRDWAAAAAGAKGVKADWGAAWRNWVRTAAEDGKPRAGPPRADPQEIRNPYLRAVQKLDEKYAAEERSRHDGTPEIRTAEPQGGTFAGGGRTILDLAAYR